MSEPAGAGKDVEKSVTITVSEPAVHTASSACVVLGWTVHIIATALCWRASEDATPLPCAGNVLFLYCAAACTAGVVFTLLGGAWCMFLLLFRAHTYINRVVSSRNRRRRSLSV